MQVIHGSGGGGGVARGGRVQKGGGVLKNNGLDETARKHSPSLRLPDPKEDDPLVNLPVSSVESLKQEMILVYKKMNFQT